MHILFVVNHTFNATPPERLQQHPLLFTTNHTDRTFFVWWLNSHNLHILVTAPFCCDRKFRAACVQSFALWQQATIEFTCHDHSIIACSCDIYVWCCSSHTSHLWWITHLMQHHRRACNTGLSLVHFLGLCRFLSVNLVLVWTLSLFVIFSDSVPSWVKSEQWLRHSCITPSKAIKLFCNRCLFWQTLFHLLILLQKIPENYFRSGMKTMGGFL